MPWRPFLATAAALAAALAPAVTGHAASPVVDPTVPAKHDADPVILTGLDFPQWSARSNVTAKLPLTDLLDCPPGSTDCNHNNYATPEVDTGDTLGDGTPTSQLLGYRWDARKRKFVQIPFQVDEMFTRYLDNSASGFAVYSGEDQHTTYAFDREGFRLREEDPSNPCHALLDSPTAADPVKGLDDNDELVFMAKDAGPQAPAGASLPKGIADMRKVRIDDPTNPKAKPTYAYVMKAAPNGAKAAFNASNGYVKYARDANSDYFAYSQSSYDSYGNAPKGHFMWNGQCVGAAPTDPGIADLCKNAPQDPPSDGDMNNLFFKCPQRHRPVDAATVTSPRYKFRYDGRWLLTGLRISANRGRTYGPDLIDRWKARAFAQDPYSETPCCGYEDEDKNWGGSSNLLGEKVGPVRAIRETWGADSGTNVIRRETFYRDTMRQKTFLRVHVIPPLDGHLRTVGFQRRPGDEVLQPAQGQGRCDRRPQRRHREPRRPVQLGLGREPQPQRLRPDLPRPLPPAAALLAAAEHLSPVGRCDRPEHGQPECDARLERGGRQVRDDRRPLPTRQGHRCDPRRDPAGAVRHALLPRRLVLRRRHRLGPRAASPAAFGRRAAHLHGARWHHEAAPVLEAIGRQSGRQPEVLPGRHRHARHAPAADRRVGQRAPDRAADGDRRRAATRVPAGRQGQRRRAVRPQLREAARRDGQAAVSGTGAPRCGSGSALP